MWLSCSITLLSSTWGWLVARQCGLLRDRCEDVHSSHLGFCIFAHHRNFCGPDFCLFPSKHYFEQAAPRALRNNTCNSRPPVWRKTCHGRSEYPTPTPASALFLIPLKPTWYLFLDDVPPGSPGRCTPKSSEPTPAHATAVPRRTAKKTESLSNSSRSESVHNSPKSCPTPEVSSKLGTLEKVGVWGLHSLDFQGVPALQSLLQA